MHLCDKNTLEFSKRKRNGLRGFSCVTNHCGAPRKGFANLSSPASLSRTTVGACGPQIVFLPLVDGGNSRVCFLLILDVVKQSFDLKQF